MFDCSLPLSNFILSKNGGSSKYFNVTFLQIGKKSVSQSDGCVYNNVVNRLENSTDYDEALNVILRLCGKLDKDMHSGSNEVKYFWNESFLA